MAIDTTNEEQHIQDLTDWNDYPDQGIDGPFSWTGNAGEGTVIRYSLDSSKSFAAGSGIGGAPSQVTDMTIALEDMQGILDSISNVADVTFIHDEQNFNLVFSSGNVSTGSGLAVLNVTGTQANQADIFLNNSNGVADTIVHEVLHILGLSHPNDRTRGINSGRDPNYDNSLTIQSYDNPVNVTVSPETPMPYDISTLQYLYGANNDHNEGSTDYTFNSDGTVTIVDSADGSITSWVGSTTFWDAGGNDTFQFASDIDSGVHVDLRGGRRIEGDSRYYSSSDKAYVTEYKDADSYSHYITNALPEGGNDGQGLIENVIGTSHDDVIIGNNLDNTLSGMDGKDEIMSVAGNDVLIGGKNDDSYIIGQGKRSSLEITRIEENNGEGTDQIIFDEPGLNPDDIQVLKLKDVNGNEKTYLIGGEPVYETINGVQTPVKFPPIIELDTNEQNPTGGVENLRFENLNLDMPMQNLPNWSNGKTIEGLDSIEEHFSLGQAKTYSEEQIENTLGVSDLDTLKGLEGNQWMNDQTLTFDSGMELIFSFGGTETVFTNVGDPTDFSILNVGQLPALNIPGEIEILFDSNIDTILDTPNNSIFLYDTDFQGGVPVPKHKPVFDNPDWEDGDAGNNMLMVDADVLTGTYAYQIVIGGTVTDDLSPGRGVMGSSNDFLDILFSTVDDIFMGIADTIGSVIDSAVSTITNVFTSVFDFSFNIDPLVIDMDSDGIELLSFDQSFAVFDVDNDGFMENTGWVCKDDAFLVHDLNNDGVISDITEMLSEYYNGGSYSDGFSALKTLDGNNDDVFDSDDALFSTLKIWQDLNEDGITDSGELKTLSEAGVQSINLVSENLSRTEISGNPIFSNSEVTISSITHTIASVDFVTNPLGYEWNNITEGFQITTEDGQSSLRVQDLNGGAIDLSVINTDADVTNDAVAVVGNIGDDTLAGDDQDNWLMGASGKDSLIGGAGNDFLVIDAEDDLEGIDGGEGIDTIIISGLEGMTVNLSDLNAEIAIGSEYSDVLIGGGNSNVFIRGGAGNDTIIGGSADDVLSGENGNDVIDGGLGNDVLRGHRGQDTILGNDGNDRLEGGQGDDKLYGNVGQDLLIGGQGNDTLDGGLGYDVAEYVGAYQDYNITTLSDGRIQISDTVVGRDGVDILKDIEAVSFNNLNEIRLDEVRPLTNDDIIEIVGQGTQIITASSILTNDFDLQGDTLFVASISDVIGGTAVINGNGDISFTFDETFAGVKSFKYKIVDSQGNAGVTVIDSGSQQTAEIQGTVYLKEASHPDDPLFYEQWYVNDIDFLPVWQDYSGKNVNVGIFELGSFDTQHPDLENNSTQLAKDSIDFYNMDNHATLVAGIIAADNNDIGTIGVAYDASIDTYGMEFNSFFYYAGIDDFINHDIVNNSWGATIDAGFWFNFNSDFNDIDLYYSNQYVTDPGALSIEDLIAEIPEAQYLNLPEELWQKLQDPNVAHYTTEESFDRTVTFGRNDLGTTIIFGAGNDRQEGWSANVSSLTNNPYTITVGSVNKQANTGSLEVASDPFSNPGANILVSASGSNMTLQPHQFENSNGTIFGSSYDVVQGTSFATPIVSGVVALMLEANPDLGWRDVQEILAYSARIIDDANTSWQTNGALNWNGGGLHFSHDYGFGNIDALAAVRMAETWSTQQTSHNMISTQTYTSNVNTQIPDNGTLVDTINVDATLPIEHVKLTLDFTHEQVGDLIVKLTSPDGTESIILDRLGQDLDDSSDRGWGAEDMVFSFGSRAHYGELSEGVWTLEVSDAAGGNIGTLRSWSLDFVGKEPYHTVDSIPPESDIYVYTNEYLDLTDTARQTLIDDDDGDDVINVAAITGDVSLDLNENSTSLLAGKALTIGTGSIIERAYTGDGDDIITGNASNNLLYSGRGDDSIDGGLGNDWLIGKSGLDQLTGGLGYDRFVIEVGDVGVTTIKDFSQAEGDKIVITKDDTLSSIADLSMSEQGNDVVINLSADQTIVIENMSLVNLADNDFVFTPDFSHRLVRLEEYHGGTIGDNPDIGNTFIGYAMYGYDGDDTLFGSYGNDTIYGGDGSDTIVGAPDSSISYGGEDYLYGEGGVDYLYGSGGRDYIDGGADADIVFAGQGNDVIYLNGTFDQVHGESGNDLFIVSNSSDLSGSDLIVDFDYAEDRIDLRDFKNISNLEDLEFTYNVSSSSGTPYMSISFNDPSSTQDIALWGYDSNVNITEGNFIFFQNALPETIQKTYEVNEDTSYMFSSSDLILNDFDPDGGVIEFTKLISLPEHGTFLDDGNGNYTYTPDQNFSGTDKIVYEIIDSSGETATGEAILKIIAENDAPVFDLTDTIVKKTGKNFFIDLRAYDADGDFMSYDLTMQDSSALPSWVTFNSDTQMLSGQAPLTPEILSLRLSVTDGVDTTYHDFDLSIATRAPTAFEDDSFIGVEDTQLTGNVLADNGNGVDSDPDGDALTVVAVTSLATALGGTVDILSNGDFTYTPAANVFGQDSFSYTLDDGNGGSDIGMVSILVNAVNDLPVAQNDSFVGTEDTQLTGNVLADNGNGVDGDPEGNTLTVVAVTGLATTLGGSVDILSNGDFTYTPAADVFGEDSFSYTLDDGNGGSDTATVTITISDEVDTFTGDTSDNTLIGTDGADLFYGGLGSDTLSGGNGGDKYYFTGGQDTITESGGNDVIYLPDGVTVSQISFIRYAWAAADLVIHVDDTDSDPSTIIGDIIVTNQFMPPESNQVETLRFVDGANEFDADLTNQYVTTFGSNSGDTILGIDFGANPNETFIGFDDNDTIYAGGGQDAVYGGTGEDHLYGEDGADFLYGNQDGDFLYGGNGNDFIFGDKDDNAISSTYTGDDYIEGGAGVDWIEGNKGVDTIYGGTGDDIIQGNEDSDFLYGETGQDYIIGGAGNDYIVGGQGIDDLFGQSGADTFAWLSGDADAIDNVYDFSTSEGDVLDISKILTGYTEGTSDITEFVQITENGTDSTLAVDVDGGGDNFVTIATLYGLTGETATSLHSNNNLNLETVIT